MAIAISLAVHVESLAIALERTQIARDIHDSLEQGYQEKLVLIGSETLMPRIRSEVCQLIWFRRP